jgi:hypothetical protein
VSRPSVPDEERLHVHAQIFRLLEHGMIHTQRQLCDVFRWRTELCQDREDHVNITRVTIVVTRLWVAVSRLWVAATELWVSVSQSWVVSPSGWGNLACLLTATVAATTAFLLG